MRLDQELVLRKLCDSRTEAQELIALGAVYVDGDVCLKQTKDILQSNVLVVTRRRTFVSRGGEKLHGVLTDLYLDEDGIRRAVEGSYVLDIGSSTGGFTDCMLRYGADHVDAVDVGRQQLHDSLRGNPNISLFEETDIRVFERQHEYDYIVADMSFIALIDVLDDVMYMGAQGKTKYVLLIKPQFEVGKGNTKKGIVKDGNLIEEVLARYEKDLHARGLRDIAVFPCRIQGGDGNQEYFIYGYFA
jgi:23S rRNA (cytidine1920-2'-O)/16S rRNA (cytidine1409-2'-O)-methyltransferase